MSTTTVPASVTSLESLVAFLNAHRQEIRDESLDVTSLPTFGGAPVDELGVYSWDSERLLVDDNGAWALVPRRERCQCGEIFGGKCDADPAPRSSFVPVPVVPAVNVEEARKANNPQAYTHTIHVLPGCRDAMDALEDSEFVDADRTILVGARA